MIYILSFLMLVDSKFNAKILTPTIVTAINFNTKAQNFVAFELLFEQSWLSLIFCFVFDTASTEKKFFSNLLRSFLESLCFAFHFILPEPNIKNLYPFQVFQICYPLKIIRKIKREFRHCSMRNS